MKVELTPILEKLRDIYDVEGVMPRFETYVSLMTGETSGEWLPLGVFSPMGKKQAAYLDKLIEQGAEHIAEKTANKAAERLSVLSGYYRILLVVADVARNGWTQRYLTDAEWRFYDKYNTMPQEATATGFDRWVTIQLWTDEEPTETYIRQETLAAIYRAAHLKHFGVPRTLEAMMLQEGRALAFAGCTPELEKEDIMYSREVIQPYLKSTDNAVCFTALYGDDIARAAGYPPLGLSRFAGMIVGLVDALEKGSIETCLTKR